MKKIFTFILFLIVSFTFGQVASGCGSTNWPSNVPVSSGVSFSVPAGTGTGWTYVWVVSPSTKLTILSGQGTPTVIVKGVTGASGTANVYVTKYKDGISACSDMKTVTVGSSTGDLCSFTLGILDEYVDGTQSGSDTVHLSVSGNYPTGTTYSWTITRQDGSVQYYPPQATRVRIVAASIDNRITDATVEAIYQNCTSVVSKNFRCAIPNADIYGNLFPECQGINYNGLFRQATDIKISPNPTNATITFEGKDLKNHKVTIYDSNGVEIIKNSKIYQNISLEKQNKGIYFYVITDENGFQQKGKIIKE